MGELLPLPTDLIRLVLSFDPTHHDDFSRVVSQLPTVTSRSTLLVTSAFTARGVPWHLARGWCTVSFYHHPRTVWKSRIRVVTSTRAFSQG